MNRFQLRIAFVVIMAMLVPISSHAQEDTRLCNLAFSGQAFQRIACNDLFQRLNEMQSADAEIEAIAARYLERREVFDLIPWPVTPQSETEAAMVSTWLEGARAEHLADLVQLNRLISQRQLLLAQVVLLTDNLEQVRDRIVGRGTGDGFLAGLGQGMKEAALDGAIALINSQVDRAEERAKLGGWSDLENELALLAADFDGDDVIVGPLGEGPAEDDVATPAGDPSAPGGRVFVAVLDPGIVAGKRPVSQSDSVLRISLSDGVSADVDLHVSVLTAYEGRKGCYLLEGVAEAVEIGEAGDFATELKVAGGGYDHPASAGDPCPLMSKDEFAMPLSGVYRADANLIEAELGWLTGPLRFELHPETN